MATPITIKRYNSSSWDTLHPITEGQNVYGSGTKATTALLDSNNKLARDFLQLYEHNIFIYNGTAGCISCRLITTSSTQITTYSALASALYNNNYKSSTVSSSQGFLTASGYWSKSNTETILAIGIYATSETSISYRYVTIASYNSSNTTTTIPTTSPSYSSGTLVNTNNNITSSNITVNEYVRTL